MTDLIDYKQTDEYQAIIDECKTILTQRIKNSRMEVILAYGEVGETIVKSGIYQKFAKGNHEFINGMAKDIGIGYSEASRAIQFYEKFCKGSPVSETIIEQFEEGENISWHKIKTRYLTDGKEKNKHQSKTFYKMGEIKKAFCKWFEDSSGGTMSEELDNFLNILTK